MSSQFDMNQPPKICHICGEVHNTGTPCKYDSLVRVILTMKANHYALMKSNKELVDVAHTFRNLLQDRIPEMARLVAIEQEYFNMLNSLETAEVFPFAPSSDQNKPTPLVGVSTDFINSLIPTDHKDKVEFENWLRARHAALYNPAPEEPEVGTIVKLGDVLPNGTEELQTETPN
jgi:hypothetical protein